MAHAINTSPRPLHAPAPAAQPVAQAYRLLLAGFAALPVIAGLVTVSSTSDVSAAVFVATREGIATLRGLSAPIDAANIAYNLLKTAAGGGIAIGPVLLGAAKPVHILTPSATVRRIVNMTALTVADAEAGRASGPAT